MNQIQFESRLAYILEKLDKAKDSYNFTNAKEKWGNVGTNPLDIAFTELSNFYLESDDIQKRHIYNSIATTPSLHQLRDFISRIGKQIHSQADSKWLELGIAAAMIDGARVDSQNLIKPLVLLRFAAELSGIRAKSFFDKAIQNSDQKKVQILNILKSVRDYKNAGIHHSVQTCGDAEWISKSIV